MRLLLSSSLWLPWLRLLPDGLKAVGYCNACACRVGDKIFGQGTGCLGTAVVVNARTVVAMPPSLTFAQAATVPTVFLTAQHCLVDAAAIGASDRVLVHAATGARSSYNEHQRGRVCMHA